jgi:hypothetical protein
MQRDDDLRPVLACCVVGVQAQVRLPACRRLFRHR